MREKILAGILLLIGVPVILIVFLVFGGLGAVVLGAIAVSVSKRSDDEVGRFLFCIVSGCIGAIIHLVIVGYLLGYFNG